ncbi:MAG: DUF1778 domain-containing protein [Novosphingobium sp.]
MAQGTGILSARITLRFTKDELALIDQAASLLGQSRTQFLRETAIRAAEEVIREIDRDGA